MSSRGLARAILIASSIAASAQRAQAQAGRPTEGRPAGHAAETLAPSGPFDPLAIEALARSLAQAPFVPAPARLPGDLAHLDYDQYRDIRVRPSATIWAHAGSRFRVQLLPLGFLFTTPVEIAIVKGRTAQHVAYSPDMFTVGKLVPAPLPTQDIGFSGFRLLYPLNDPRRFDEVAVFQGASYFRSLGRDQGYGLSARGLALDVGRPSGEEFPVFRAFWIEEPPARSSTITVHAVLDSPSVTGAYRFEIHPGRSTVMRVDAVLFPRVALEHVGLAPGTTMFMFAPSDRTGTDDFRPQVHDSDGLLVFNGRGEHLWRPLANPAKLQLSSFVDQHPQGFGLMQRDRSLSDYQDFESHFERRPSLWVEPLGDWGDGDVVLVEIPSDSEIHDNIVAYWHPRKPLAAGSEFRASYRLTWGGEPSGSRGLLRVLSTAAGRADVKRSTPVRRFVIDYGGSPCTDCAVPNAVVTASAGKVGDVVVTRDPLTRGYRVSFTLDPQGSELSELRAELEPGDSRRAEVWLYRWTKR